MSIHRRKLFTMNDCINNVEHEITNIKCKERNEINPICKSKQLKYLYLVTLINLRAFFEPPF